MTVPSGGWYPGWWRPRAGSSPRALTSYSTITARPEPSELDRLRALIDELNAALTHAERVAKQRVPYPTR